MHTAKPDSMSREAAMFFKIGLWYYAFCGSIFLPINTTKMLLVRTKIAPSTSSGIGLFADQFIPKGTMVWKFMPGFDLLMAEEEIKKLSVPTREQFYNYAYLDKKYGKYLLCSDDARFFNHSDQPNCDERTDDITTATRDIKAGEELIVNYKDFYGDIQRHKEIMQGV